jgi:hypothetical protein
LPSASEQYQLEFFEEGGKGYVYIASGGDQFGPGSLYVNQSESREVLLIENGVIVWEEGTTAVSKTFLDFREVGVEDGRYLVCYQLIYDDEPEALPYSVEDFSLGGLDLTIEDSASQAFRMSGDAANPWPFPGANLFAPSEAGLQWKNFIDVVNRSPGQQAGVKPGFPEYEQPLLSWVSWQSKLPWKLDTIKVRTDLTVSVPPCSLYFASENPDEEWELVQQIAAKVDSTGFYWEFETDAIPQRSWKLDWGENNKVSANNLLVSGILYVEARPSVPRARAQLALYPTNLVPKDESLCNLAVISVDNFKLATRDSGRIWKDDIRDIINRDYEPVANWLTQYWDSQLITLWEEAKGYSPLYMAPPTLLKDAYSSLDTVGINVVSATPIVPPVPADPPEALFVKATVSFQPDNG